MNKKKMKQTYMVEFMLPDELTEEFVALIPRQRYIINQMLVEGTVQAYSLSGDRSRLWAIMSADNEDDLYEQIDRMPLRDFMIPEVTELMFHQSASSVMHFSLN